MSSVIIVDIDTTLPRYETYPGELFCRDTFDVIGVQTHTLQSCYQYFPDYQKSVAVVQVSNGIVFSPIDLSRFGMVVALDEEAVLNPNTVLQTLRAQFNNNNVKYVVGGCSKKYQKQYHVPNQNVYIHPFVMLGVSKYNNFRRVPSLTCHKKYFDVLLGSEKRHRRWLFDKMQQQNLLKLAYVNLTGPIKSAFDETEIVYRTKGINSFEEPCVQSIVSKKFGFNSRKHIDVLNQNETMNPRASYMVPWRLYEQTLYSVVTETNDCIEDNIYFFTEKTGKCLFAHRPFVLFSGQGHLRYLKSMGFKTFESVIDESYDDIADYETRWNAAFAQLQWLVQQPPREILTTLRPILAHNSFLIRNTDYFTEPLRAWLESLIDNAV